MKKDTTELDITLLKVGTTIFTYKEGKLFKAKIIKSKVIIEEGEANSYRFISYEIRYYSGGTETIAENKIGSIYFTSEVELLSHIIGEINNLKG